MYLLKKINLDDAWQKEQGWNEERKSGRKFDDRKELEFWEKLAPHYSEQFNLYRDVPGLKEKIFPSSEKILRSWTWAAAAGISPFP